MARARKATASNEALVAEPTKMPDSSSPLIFISHDSRDADLAEAFSKLLTNVSAGVLKSFRSSDSKGSQGIEYGVEWYPELMRKLEMSSDVVCLLTPRSLDRPWILYEAGVAKGKLATPVYGIALGVPLGKASTGPFAQFQNSDDNEESMTKLVMQLLRRIPDSEPDHDAVLMQVKTFKGRADEILAGLGDARERNGKKASVDESSVATLFEEVKVMFQDLPSRLEDRLGTGSESTKRRRFRRGLHPRTIDDFVHFVGGKGQDASLGILFLACQFRDDFPWLYELGMEAYHAARFGNRKRTDDAAQRFLRAAHLTASGPLGDDLMTSREAHTVLRELPMAIEYLMDRYPQSKSETDGI